MKNDITWIAPSTTGRRMNKNADITVRCYPVNSDNPAFMRIVFHNGSWSKVTQHDGVSLGINPTKHQLLFKDPYPSSSGWKLSKIKNSRSRCIRVKFTDKSFEGEYILMPDDEDVTAWHTEKIR